MLSHILKVSNGKFVTDGFITYRIKSFNIDDTVEINKKSNKVFKDIKTRIEKGKKLTVYPGHVFGHVIKYFQVKNKNLKIIKGISFRFDYYEWLTCKAKNKLDIKLVSNLSSEKYAAKNVLAFFDNGIWVASLAPRLIKPQINCSNKNTGLNE